MASFLPAAEQEFLDAVAWYLREGSPTVAQDFNRSVQRAVQLLSVMPRLGTPAYRDARLWPLKGFAYTLVYRVKGDALTVLALAHQRREAGYWRGRK
jgi:plasmid stabilization system protein ParE